MAVFNSTETRAYFARKLHVHHFLKCMYQLTCSHCLSSLTNNSYWASDSFFRRDILKTCTHEKNITSRPSAQFSSTSGRCSTGRTRVFTMTMFTVYLFTAAVICCGHVDVGFDSRGLDCKRKNERRLNTDLWYLHQQEKAEHLALSHTPQKWRVECRSQLGCDQQTSWRARRRCVYQILIPWNNYCQNLRIKFEDNYC